MNELGGTGLWDEQDGFYYDRALVDGRAIPLRVRSMVGLIPLFAVETLDAEQLSVPPPLPRSGSSGSWRTSPSWRETSPACTRTRATEHRLLAVPTRERLQRVLQYLLDEREFLSPYGVRSLSKFHLEHPGTLRLGDELLRGPLRSGRVRHGRSSAGTRTGGARSGSR